MRRLPSPLLPAVLLLSACSASVGEGDPAAAGEDGADGSADGSDGTGETGGTEGDLPVGDGCRATPASADRPRVVLTNLPYDGAGTQWAVLDLSEAGTLTDRGERLTAGRSYDGLGASTPDGSLLVVAQDDGTVGIFAVDEAGAVTVVDPGWSDGTYASAVAVDPSGERLYVLDGSRGDVGGGVFVALLDCDTGAATLATAADGLPVDASGRLLVADHPKALFFPDPSADEAVLVAQNPGGVADGAELAVIAPSTGAVLHRIDAFGDPDDAWLGAAGWSHAHQLALVGDGSSWSGRENSVAGVVVSESGLTAAGAAEVFDPAGIAAYGDVAVASSGFGDELIVLSIDPSGVTATGTLATSGVPQSMAMVLRGARGGLAFVNEVDGLRQVQLTTTEGVEDLGVVDVGGGGPGGLVLQR